jgi:hypothetical protein
MHYSALWSDDETEVDYELTGCERHSSFAARWSALTKKIVVDIAANRRANHPTAAGERRNLRTAPENVFGGGGDGITFEDACCVAVTGCKAWPAMFAGVGVAGPDETEVEVEAELEVVEPGAEVVEPGAEFVEVAAEVVEAGADVVEAELGAAEGGIVKLARDLYRENLLRILGIARPCGKAA